MLEIEKKQIIELHGYNEMADYIYRSILKEDKIILEGKLRNKYVEIEFINKIWLKPIYRIRYSKIKKKGKILWKKNY